MFASRSALALATVFLAAPAPAAQVTITDLTEATPPTGALDEMEIQPVGSARTKKVKVGNLVVALTIDAGKTACANGQGLIAASGELLCVAICQSDGTGCPADPVLDLDDLFDVNVVGQAAGEALVSDGAAWAPSAAAVCLANGTNCPASSAALGDLTDVDVTGSDSGEGLVFDGAGWVASTDAVCLADGSGCPPAPALGGLADVNTTGIATGEGVVFGGIGWVATAARLCLEDGTNCPSSGATTLDALTDVDVAGQTAGEALVSNGTTWAPSTATVCLSDGTNCPAASPPGWIDEAGALAASDGAADWLSRSGSTVTVDANADAVSELLISRISDRGAILSPSGSNLAIGGVGGSSVVVYTNSTDRFYINDNGISTANGAGFFLRAGGGTVVAPNLAPHQSDDDTGIRADGTNTLFISCGGETCSSYDNDGTNHKVTITADTGQSGAVFAVETSAAATLFGVDQYAPYPPTYSTLPACGSRPIVAYDDSGAFCGCVPGTGWTLLGGLGLCS